MQNMIFPAGYRPVLDIFETQRAIKIVKDTFERVLAAALNLERVTAPVIVRADSGINDDLNGVERKVHFTMKEIGGEAEVVQSLAKWKRMALMRYNFRVGKGLYTDMSAIRRDDDADNLHSIYVDQWDWEKIITRDQRTEDYLRATVTSIVRAICATHLTVKASYPQLTHMTCETPFFITSQELADLYPDLDPHARENRIVKEHKTVFIMQIGGKLRDGSLHGHPRGREVAGGAAGGCRMRGQNEVYLPSDDRKRHAAADHRRRYRAVAPLHADAGKGAHRRGAVLGLARGDGAEMRRRGDHPTVKVG